MPNKCTVCGKVHPDDAKYLLDGCDKCGSKFFFYVREGALKKAEEDMKKLSKSDIKEIEEDIRFIIPKEVEKGETVILDLEAIHVIKPGKYEIDVTNLFTQKPVVIKVGPGKYEIDLSTLISKWREKLAAYRKEAEDEEGEPAEEEPEEEAKEGISEEDGEDEDREEEEKHLNSSDK
jgi:predicted  nucleic acid-binding Zn-ribbon protein